MISTRTLFHRLVATLLVLVATFSTALADESGTGWSYNSSTNTLTLSGSNVDWGTIKNFKEATKYVLFADDYSVTSIPDNAFNSFSKLERIVIPSAVTSIGNDAFYTCTSLYSVSFPEGLKSIGQYAFFYCSSLYSITLPSSLTSMGKSVFGYCNHLSSVTISSGVTSIGDYAFRNCISLYSITLPSSLTSIGDYAFSGCSSLGSVKILSDGTSDNKHFVYLGSESDKNATGSNVFPQNQATLVYDPTNTWIGDEDTQNLRYYFNKFSFQGTGWSYNSSTNTLTLSGGNVDWNAIKYFSSTTEKVVFAKNYSVSSIPNGAFKGFSKLAAIDISSVVTSIGNSAFYGCTSLASVSFPTSLISIDMAAFDGCTSLASISLPDGLQSVGTGAFYGCTALSSVSLPATLTSLGTTTFAGCTSLNSVEILSNGTSDNKQVIYLGGSTDKTSTGTQVFPIHQATLIYDPATTWIGDDNTQNLRYYFNDFLSKGTGWAYDYASNTLTLFGSEVDWYAIKDFSSTTENVVFADDYSVASIPQEAFRDFSKLTAIDIPNVVTSIGNYAFSGCTTLSSVSLSANLTTVEYCTFSDCISLSSVVLPDGLESIVDEAFSGCTTLSSVSLPASLTSIGGSAFSGCTTLSSVSLPASLTSLGGSAFYNCTSLTSITLPASLTSIDEYAFAGCTSLSSVSLPDGLQSIGDGTFAGCTSLSSVSLPDGLQSIGDGTFAECTSLSSITLPASLTSIGEYAFADCTALISVEILSNGTSDDQHVIYLGSDTDDKTATSVDVFPRHQATLTYDPNTTWIGDNETQNLRYYFNSFATPTSLHSNTISTSAPQYYDLSGRPVSPTTHKGIAVKLQDGNSSLITIK